MPVYLIHCPEVSVAGVTAPYADKYNSLDVIINLCCSVLKMMDFVQVHVTVLLIIFNQFVEIII